MTKEDIQKQFWHLISVAEKRWHKTMDTFDMEPALVDILNFVKRYPEHKDTMEHCFIELVYSKEWKVSIDVLEFCMHELRWLKVKEVIESIVRNSQDIRERDALYHISESYLDDWDGVDFYNYYSRSK